MQVLNEMEVSLQGLFSVTQAFHTRVSFNNVHASGSGQQQLGSVQQRGMKATGQVPLSAQQGPRQPRARVSSRVLFLSFLEEHAGPEQAHIWAGAIHSHIPLANRGAPGEAVSAGPAGPKAPLMAQSAVRAVDTFLPIQSHLPLSVTSCGSQTLATWPRWPNPSGQSR